MESTLGDAINDVLAEKEEERQRIKSFMESLDFVYVTQAEGHIYDGFILRGPRGSIVDWTVASELYAAFHLQTIEARIDELVETYNENFIHWGDDLGKAKMQIQKRLADLHSTNKEKESHENI